MKLFPFFNYKYSFVQSLAFACLSLRGSQGKASELAPIIKTVSRNIQIIIHQNNGFIMLIRSVVLNQLD